MLHSLPELGKDYQLGSLSGDFVVFSYFRRFCHVTLEKEWTFSEDTHKNSGTQTHSGTQTIDNS